MTVTEISSAAREALASVPSGYLADTWRQPATGRTFGVTDPATEQPIAEVADCGEPEGELALQAAAAALPEWATTPPRRRADVLHRLYALMHRDRERLAQLITAEVGKTLGEARGEVDYAADYVRWYAEEAVRPAGRSTAAPDGQSHIVTVTEPVGVCLLITPWNVPLAMAARKVAPALAAGCTAILKPADLTPLTSLVFAELTLEAGAPAGSLGVLPTTGPAPLSRFLMSDSRLAKVSFTGSTAVGRLLLEQAGPRVLRTSMELGGNAPFVVLEDADLDLAVEQAFIAKMRLGGQSCVAANRYYVHADVADAFVAGLARRMAAVRVGDPTADGVELGPLIDTRAVAKARRLVDDALARGARLAGQAGLPDGPGHYFAPTVLDDVPADAAIATEEVFAPVAAIYRVGSDAEALDRANDTEHGLAAFVITRDLDRARRFGAGLRAGMVGINRGLVSNVAAPFGGIKQSGLGREGGAEGLLEYQQLKYIASPGYYT